MKRNIANEKEFDEKLKQLGDLYEEGKDLITALAPDILHTPSNFNKTSRLLEVLREMRDLAAIQMQSIHWQEEN